jgi:hypothetical protein
MRTVSKKARRKLKEWHESHETGRNVLPEHRYGLEMPANRLVASGPGPSLSTSTFCSNINGTTTTHSTHTSNLSYQPGRTSLSFSRVGPFHLVGKKFHLCMRHADTAHQIVLTGRAVLIRGDLRVSFPLAFPALGELRLPFA